MQTTTKAKFIDSEKTEIIEIPEYYNSIYNFWGGIETENEDSELSIAKDLFLKGLTKIYCKTTNKKFLFTHLDLLETDNQEIKYTFSVLNMMRHLI